MSEETLTVLLIPGHEYEKPGVSKFGVTEYDFGMNVTTEIFRQEKSGNVSVVLMSRNVFKTHPQDINNLDPDLVIEFHLNAFNGNVQGTETLHFNGSKIGERVAQRLQDYMLELGYNDRGLKPITNGDLGGHLITGTKAPAIILEPFFIDSIETKEEVEENKEKIINLMMEFLEDLETGKLKIK